MPEVKNISPAQRAANFASATRQNLHMLPTQTVNQMGSTLQFTFPKARLLSKTSILFDVYFTLGGTNATTDNVGIRPQDFNMIAYNFIRRISLSLNNGFDPFVISGRDLAILNVLRVNPETIFNSNGLIKLESLNGGKFEPVIDNEPLDYNGSPNTTRTLKLSFVLELENTLNQRDIGTSLLLLQNESTMVTLSIDLISDISEIVNAIPKYLTRKVERGNFEKCVVTPMLHTWTIPNYAEAFPDLSVIKLVKSRTETVNAGENILKLDVGTIYRKLVLYTTDVNGKAKDVINGNIELVFNTADTPISINAEMLKMKNTSDFGYRLPEGMYVFDFSGYPGFSSMAGSRDYIDTERLSEFWVRLSTTENCKITTIQENLSRLR